MFNNQKDVRGTIIIPSYDKETEEAKLFVSPVDFTPYDIHYMDKDSLKRKPHHTNFLKVGCKIPNLLSLCELGCIKPGPSDEITIPFVFSVLVKIDAECFVVNVERIEGNCLRPIPSDGLFTYAMELNAVVSSDQLVNKHGDCFAELKGKTVDHHFNLKLVYDRSKLSLESSTDLAKNDSDLEVIGFSLEMELLNLNKG